MVAIYIILSIMKTVKRTKGKTSYWLICESCNTEYEFFGAKSRAKTRRFCSRSCLAIGARGKNSPLWQGGYTRQDGYKVIVIDGKRKLKHRHIMEQHLGCPLAEKETVHHVDGDPGNNDIENLVVLQSRGQHNNHHATTFRDTKRKQCTKCLKIKPRSEFSKNRSNPTDFDDPHDTRCKECRQEIKRERNKANV